MKVGGGGALRWERGGTRKVGGMKNQGIIKEDWRDE